MCRHRLLTFVELKGHFSPRTCDYNLRGVTKCLLAWIALETILASVCLVSFIAALAGTRFLLCARNDLKPRSSAAVQVERIYVARSVRESRMRESTNRFR